MNHTQKWVRALLSLLVMLAAAGAAHAQGSRKDDIVLSANGTPVAGATIRVCTSAGAGQPCNPLASIYSDLGLTMALPNPTTADANGNYFFYAAPGRYEIEISGPGLVTKQTPNVILPSDPSGGGGGVSWPLTSPTSNPATAGQIRLAFNDFIDFRNNANSANLPFGINASNYPTFNSAILCPFGTSSGQLLFMSAGGCGGDSHFTVDIPNTGLHLNSGASIIVSPNGSPGTLTLNDCGSSNLPWAPFIDWHPVFFSDSVASGNTTRWPGLCVDPSSATESNGVWHNGLLYTVTGDISISDIAANNLGVYGTSGSPLMPSGTNFIVGTNNSGQPFTGLAQAIQWDPYSFGENSPSMVVTPNATPGGAPTFDFGVFVGVFPLNGPSLTGITDNAIVKAGQFTPFGNILPNAAATSNLGSATLPFLNIFFGSAANDTVELDGANLTADRTWEAADASGTVAPVTGSPTNNGCLEGSVDGGGHVTGIHDAGVGPCTGSAGTTVALSALTDATGTNSIQNADNGQEWQFDKTTNSTFAFQLDESAASTCTTCGLFFAHTASTSTMNPFKVTAGGLVNGIQMSTAGVLAAIGSGVINANEYKGGAAGGVGDCGAHNFVRASVDATTPTCGGAALSTAGDIWYDNGSGITRFAGNTSGTGCFSENASGVPAWQIPCGGGGTVTVSGTPAVNSFAQWISSTAIQGLASVGGGMNPLMVTLTAPSQGDYPCENGAIIMVNCTPGIVPNPQAATTYAVASTDRGKVITVTDASNIAVSVSQAGTAGFASNFYFKICAAGGGDMVLTPATSTINGNAALTILSGQCATWNSDNTNYTAQVTGYASGASSSIGGGALSAGACTSGTVTINGAATGMDAHATPTTYPGDGNVWSAYVSASNTVTVKVCSIAGSTPTASVYNVRLFP